MIKRLVLIGIIVGILFSVANLIFWGIPVAGFTSIMPAFSLFSPSSCTGEECLGISTGIFIGIIFIPLVFAFLGYFFDTKKYPFTGKKLIIVFIIILIFLASNAVGFLEAKAQDYSMDMNFIRSRHQSYKSVVECEKVMRPQGNRNDCYGYFASLENDFSLCEGYINNLHESFNKEREFAACVTSFAINQNNMNDCDRIGSNLYKQICAAEYYIAKEEHENCDKIADNYWRGQCLKDTAHTKVNSIVRKYAKVRGYLD